MRYPSLWQKLAYVVMLLGTALSSSAEKLVLASSNATRDYEQKRIVDGKRQRESYVFMAGRYLAGNTHDKSLDKTSFRTIAERLAQDLRTQDYFPADSLTKADLLLVVHWGVTAGRNRDSVALASSAENLANLGLESQVAQENLEEAIARGDMDAAGQARDILTNLGNETRSEYQNLGNLEQSGGENSAALLGLSSDLLKEDKTLFDHERRKTLFEMTRDECYFVVVMAYDAPTLVSTKKLKRVWSMRVSMSSAGVNFHQALDRLCQTASRYFGTRQDNVAFDYPADRKRKERVDLGELVVIGPVTP